MKKKLMVVLVALFALVNVCFADGAGSLGQPTVGVVVPRGTLEWTGHNGVSWMGQESASYDLEACCVVINSIYESSDGCVLHSRLFRQMTHDEMEQQRSECQFSGRTAKIGVASNNDRLTGSFAGAFGAGGGRVNVSGHVVGIPELVGTIPAMQYIADVNVSGRNSKDFTVIMYPHEDGHYDVHVYLSETTKVPVYNIRIGGKNVFGGLIEVIGVICRNSQ